MAMLVKGWLFGFAKQGFVQNFVEDISMGNYKDDRQTDANQNMAVHLTSSLYEIITRADRKRIKENLEL